jgi:hypothetical protein
VSSQATLPGYKEEFVRLLYAIIVTEFVVITILLFGFSNEYLSNAYMRTWISANLPFLGILLHGEVDALFIGVALGAMVLLIQRRVQAAKTREDPRRSVNPVALGYKPTSLVQNRTPQSDTSPDQVSLSRVKPRNETPKDDGKELKKTDS